MEELREGLTMHLQKLKELEESHSRAVEDTVQGVAAKILRHSKRVAEHTVRWNPAIGICVVRPQTRCPSKSHPPMANPSLRYPGSPHQGPCGARVHAPGCIDDVLALTTGLEL